jgi:hypothetical protein
MALLSQQLLTLRDQYCSLRVLLNTSFSQPSESRKYFKGMQLRRAEEWRFEGIHSYPSSEGMKRGPILPKFKGLTALVLALLRVLILEL